MIQRENYLTRFHTVTLEDLEIIKLLQRRDTKFIFHKNQLIFILEYLSRNYEILEIDNNRLFGYQNLYFDTDDYFFYHQHHNSKLSRYKIRCRRYIESNQCYFEVKHKDNKKKTIKRRLLLDDKRISEELSEESKKFAKNLVSINNGEIIDRVKPKLWIEFDRITFANRFNKERLTIDTNLTYSDRNSPPQKMNGLVIAELKSESFSLNSRFFQYLKSLGISPIRISKYCIGIAIIKSNIRYNRFKKKLLKLAKLNNGESII
jgi:hypothetical protein